MTDDDRSYDWNDPRVKEARDAVERAIIAYEQLIRPDEAPIVVAWGVAVEWTNMALEQAGRAGRDVITPQEQTISASAGLGLYLTDRYV